MGSCCSLPKSEAIVINPHKYLVIELLDGISIMAFVGIYDALDDAQAACVTIRGARTRRNVYVYEVLPNRLVVLADNPGRNMTSLNSIALCTVNLKSELMASSVPRVIARRFSQAADASVRRYRGARRATDTLQDLGMTAPASEVAMGTAPLVPVSSLEPHST